MLVLCLSPSDHCSQSGSSLWLPEITGTKSRALISGRCAEARTRRAVLVGSSPARSMASGVVMRRVERLDLGHQLVPGAAGTPSRYRTAASRLVATTWALKPLGITPST